MTLWSNTNSGLYPVKIYDTVAAVIDDTNNGITDTVVKSIISTSMANNIPAIGALKIAATPAAAPLPTSIIKICGDIRNKLPKLDPIAAPVLTIGPSAPTDPPKPIVIDDATTEV